MLLMQRYNQAVVAGEIQDDQLQRQIIPSLQRMIGELEKPALRWFRRRQAQAIQGLYLYGPVGAGKTFLMDLFYQCVMIPHKTRVHFHQFMQQVDAQLRLLQGHPNPLQCIAKNLAKTTHLLCLDEFLVLDVATAMILAEFIKHLLAQNVVLVITSNTCPDDLYLNGLQRVRFLPVIDLLKQHCEVFDLKDAHDYRLGRAPKLKAYCYPLDPPTQQQLEQQFDALVVGGLDYTALSVQGRVIPFFKRSEGVIWFQFDVICNLPRSQLDYLELANRFAVIFVSDIPQLTVNDTVKALLLTHFIDVMYDRRVRVIISAAVPIEALYVNGEVLTAFQRTRSRLEEMQSADYFSK
jgi:cell division protein ZapE